MVTTQRTGRGGIPIISETRTGRGGAKIEVLKPATGGVLIRKIGGGGTSGGGGSGSGARGPSGGGAPSGPSAADIAATNKRIDNERSIKSNARTNQFQENLKKNLRGITNQQDRINIGTKLRNELTQDLNRFDVEAKLARIEAGISVSGTVATSAGIQTITRENIGKFRESVGLGEKKSVIDTKKITVDKSNLLGVSSDRPGGRVLIETVGGIKKGIQKVKDVGKDIFFGRIPILDTSLSSITGKTVDTEIRIIDGEEVLVPKGSIKIDTTSKEIVPGTTGGPGVQQIFFTEPKDSIGPAPTKIERIQQFPGFIKREVIWTNFCSRRRPINKI